jgi:hypothetical protein
MSPWIERFEGYVPYTWMADTVIEPDKYYKLNSVRLFGYPVHILVKETGISSVMWSYVLNGKFKFSDIVLTHVCDRFAIPKSLVADLCRFQQEEWKRRNGDSEKPCLIPSHYAHYFEEIDIERFRKLKNKSSKVMQERYARMRQPVETRPPKMHEKAQEMLEHFQTSDEKRQKMAKQTAAGIEAANADRKRPAKVLPGTAKGRAPSGLER